MPAFRYLPDSHVPFDEHHSAHRSHRHVGALADRSEVKEVTLVLRENPAGPTIDELVDLQATQSHRDRNFLSDAQLTANHGWASADAAAARQWAEARRLTVVDEHSDQTGRRLRVRGTVAQLDAAFGTRSQLFETNRPLDGRLVQYRRTTSAPMLPSALADVVSAVQGINETPFQTRLARLAPGATPQQSYDPEELADLYNFPELPNGGEGVTLNYGISELGGAVNPAVAAWFFSQPKYQNCTMTEFGVNGQVITPDPGNADIEVALDWQTGLRALLKKAPNAKINILVGYGANSDQGFADTWNVFVTGAGVTSAKTYSAANPSGVDVDPKTIDPTSVDGVSDSWGQNESGWAPASVANMDQIAGAGALKGVFFSNASGDNGAADGRTDGKLDADAPSLCANVLAVGGTQLNSANGRIISEPVWNEALTGRGAGGSGVSRYVGVPKYMQAAGISIPAADDGHLGRVDPDIALNADPNTGYNVVTGIDAGGQPIIEVVGGTSASEPLAVAGFTLVRAMNGDKKLGRVQDILYTLGKQNVGIRDVTQGNTAYPTGTKGYDAVPGFDAASGWGSLDFAALAQAWGHTTPTPQPCPPPPTPGPCAPTRQRLIT